MRIAFFPNQPFSLAYGGFELQTADALAALRRAGADAFPFDYWSEDSSYQVIHFWGANPHHLSMIRAARSQRKRIVLTALLPYYESAYLKLRHLASRAISKAKHVSRVLSEVDALVVVNEAQREVARSFFGVAREKITVIPNIVLDEFFGGDAAAFEQSHDLRDFVLTVGNVCPRKNQYHLALAAVEARLPLVVIGPVLPGEEQYGAQLNRLLEQHPNIVWLRGLEHGSSLLVSAYHACRLFALASHAETQPIAALEAVAAGKPILLSDGGYARDPMFQGSLRANPSSVSELSAALLQVFHQPAHYCCDLRRVESCRAEAVARSYIKLYERLGN